MREILDKLKREIVETMKLEIKPEQIPDDSAIFGEGLGLDSIDALELIVLLEKNYGIKLANNESAKNVFSSVRSLAQFIKENKK